MQIRLVVDVASRKVPQEASTSLVWTGHIQRADVRGGLAGV